METTINGYVCSITIDSDTTTTILFYDLNQPTGPFTITITTGAIALGLLEGLIGPILTAAGYPPK